MARQESTAVLGVPLLAVQSRLQNVEDWPRFLVGLESVHRLAHGRYRFHVRRGRGVHELDVAVVFNPREHRVGWHCLSGPKWDGDLRLSAVDAGRTKVHLATVTEPRGFAEGVTEMLSPAKDEATLDLQRLEDLVRS